jgi:hypothetical protein
VAEAAEGRTLEGWTVDEVEGSFRGKCRLAAVADRVVEYVMNRKVLCELTAAEIGELGLNKFQLKRVRAELATMKVTSSRAERLCWNGWSGCQYLLTRVSGCVCESLVVLLACCLHPSRRRADAPRQLPLHLREIGPFNVVAPSQNIRVSWAGQRWVCIFGSEDRMRLRNPPAPCRDIFSS